MTSGSQLVSVRASTGILSLFASWTRSSSRLGSMTNTPPGRRSISVMPAKFRLSFWYSLFRANQSLGPFLLGGLVDPDGQVFEVLDARKDRLEVGEHAANVALRDKGLPTPDGLLCERDLGLLLRPYEKDLPVSLSDTANKAKCPFQQRQRLI